MTILDKRSLILRCVYLYYREKLNIQEVATRLKISRFRVSRYLKEAEEKGIVTIQINDSSISYDALGCDLEEKYSIKRVIIVPNEMGGDSESIRKRVGAKGAELLHKVEPGISIAITLGRTISYMVEGLPNTNTRLDYVAELTGGLGIIRSEFPSSALAVQFAKKFYSYCYQLAAPIIVSSCEIAQNLRSDNSIIKTLEMSKKCDIAICGVTPLTSDSMLLRTGIINMDDFTYIKKLGGVGSVIGRFFDKNGKEVDSEFRDRAISVQFDEFLKIPERIVLAGGSDKVESIHAMLKGGLATIIVMDSISANKLMEYRD